MKTRFTLFLVVWLLAVLPGGAFPPAPPFTIHGIARDSFGWALKASDQGTVVVKRGSAVVAEAPINESIRAGENFRVQVPMDVNPSDPYQATAQAPGVNFTIEVRFPGSTMLVNSLTVSQRTIGQPGDSVFLDFTIGVDSDGDGIPDAWEWWQLGEMGIGPGHPRWSLTTLGTGDYDGDGTSDYIEYLAGTFAFLNTETLSLNIEGIEPDGASRLRAFMVVEKNYRVEVSADLVTWAPVSVRIDSATAALRTTFEAADTREVTLYAPVSGTPGKLFYRLKLLR
jgi:hypothetical protein